MSTAAFAQEYTIRATATSNENDEDYDGLVVFKNYVENASNGRIAVENLHWGEQHVWAQLAGARWPGEQRRDVDAGLAIESSGTIGTESTLLLVFDASGVLKKKIVYTQSNATSNQAPTVTNY